MAFHFSQPGALREEMPPNRDNMHPESYAWYLQQVYGDETGHGLSHMHYSKIALSHVAQLYNTLIPSSQAQSCLMHTWNTQGGGFRMSRSRRMFDRRIEATTVEVTSFAFLASCASQEQPRAVSRSRDTGPPRVGRQPKPVAWRTG